MLLGFDGTGSQHITGPGHPESPARLLAVARALQSLPPRDDLQWLSARSATEDELALAHTREYLAMAKDDVAKKLTQLSTGDTNICSDSWAVATRATGLVLAAVDGLCAGEAKHRTAFCGNRPPGHHATASRGMGFCLFNHVAIAARYARKKYGLDRILIVDWDVHHGNGTQDIFYRDGHVLFCSTHQHPWYPGSGLPDENGDGPGEGRILNFPFAAGAGRKEIAGVFENQLRKAAKLFQPELVILSAGFDSRLGDPLGGFTLTDADFAHLTTVLREIADLKAGGRVLSVLEGGYSLTGLQAGLQAHLTALR